MNESRTGHDRSTTGAAPSGPRPSAVGGQVDGAPGAPRASRRRLAVSLGCFGLAGLLLTACGAGGSASPHTTIRPRPTSSTSVSSTTTDPASTAVLSAYRASWRAFEGAAGDANPEDPALAATMVDPQHPALHKSNLSPELPGDVIALAGTHAKVRRNGYRNDDR